MYKSKKKKGSDSTLINAAAIQDHILRTYNFALKPLLNRPSMRNDQIQVIPRIQVPVAGQVAGLAIGQRNESRGKVLLPKLGKNQFLFEQEEDKFKNEQQEQGIRIQKAYNKKLTLAQKLGLFAAPPKPMSLDEWEIVEEHSKKRGDDGLCPICLEQFKNQEHTILSCSHVFHKTCLDSFEKYNKIKVCPICRRQDYEKKRYIHAHRTFAINSVVRIQSYYRGYSRRILLYEQLISQGYKPSSLRLKRRLMFYKLSKITSKIHKNLDKRNKQVQETVDDLNQQYIEKKTQIDDQIQKIMVIKQSNFEEGIEILDKNTQQIQTKLTTDEWQKVKDKALNRCDKDCIICFQPLKSSKGVYLLSCSHFFHASCLNAFERYSVKQSSTCPVCRSEYEKMHMLFK